MRPAPLLAALAVLVTVILLFLSGCASSTAVQRKQAWVGACESYASALVSLWGYNQQGRLSEGDVKTILHWREVIDPICLAKEPPTDGSLLDTVEEGVMALLMLQKEKA